MCRRSHRRVGLEVVSSHDGFLCGIVIDVQFELLAGLGTRYTVGEVQHGQCKGTRTGQSTVTHVITGVHRVGIVEAGQEAFLLSDIHTFTYIVYIHS